MSSYELASCPVCGTTNFRQLADQRAIIRQLEDVWEFQTRRIRDGAPVQQLFDRAVFSQNPPFHLVQCADCGTVLRNPRESAADLVEGYANEPLPRSALTDLFNAQLDFYRPRADRLRRQLDRLGSVLEVGSYVGAFLRAATEVGLHAEGIDVNEAANAFAAGRGCTVHRATIEEWQPARRYDVVALWNCLDQLPDPRGALVRAHDLLENDGLLVLRVPNGACYAALLNAPLGKTLLAHNNLLGFPYRTGFCVRALRRLLGEAGFRDAHARGDTLVSTAGTWTKRRSVLEERVVKTMMRRMLPARLAPWLEFYAWKR